MSTYVDSISRRPPAARPRVVRAPSAARPESGTVYRRTARAQPLRRQPNVYRRVALVLALLLMVAGFESYTHDNPSAKALGSTNANATQQTTTPAQKTPTPTTSSTTAQSIGTQLVNSWKSIVSGRQGSIDIAVYNHATGQTAQYSNTSATFDTASIVKLSILEGLLVEDQDNGHSLTASQLAQAKPMIENSDNDAASDLWSTVGGAIAMNNFFKQVGATSTTAGADGAWGLTQTTALDQLQVINALAYPGALLSDASATAADSLLDQVEADQRWGVSGGVPTNVSVELKDGWLPEANGWVINSVGHVHGDGTDYTIAVTTSRNPSEQYGISTIQSLSSATWSKLATP